MIILASHPAAPTFYGTTKVIMFALPLLGVWLGISCRPLFKGGGVKDIFLGIALGAFFFLALFGIYTLFPTWFADAAKEALPRAATFGIGTPTTFLMAGVLFSILHSFFEEYYWRWFVFGGLTSYVSEWAAIVLSGVAFSLHHILILLPFVSLPIALLGGASVGAVGSLWAFIYNKRKNLLAPWISHIAADLAIIYVIYQLLFP